MLDWVNRTDCQPRARTFNDLVLIARIRLSIINISLSQAYIRYRGSILMRMEVVMCTATQTIAVPECAHNRLELACRLHREYHVRSFGNSPRDLEITEDDLPFVAEGLRLYGGHIGFKPSGKLRSNASDRNALECR